MDGAILPYDGCPSCHGLMMLEEAEFLDKEEVFGFRCRRCGAHESRSALPRGAPACPAAVAIGVDQRVTRVAEAA